MRKGTAPILSLSFLNGLGILTFEIAVFKLLSLHLGTSAGAVALVLAAYLAGLGTGYGIVGLLGAPGRVSVRPLTLLQAAAGLLALGAPWLLQTLDRASAGGGGATWIQPAAAFTVVFTCALPAGTAVPLLYRLALPLDPSRRILAFVYGINILGSVAAVAVSVFLLIPRFGLNTAFALSAGFHFLTSLGASRIRPGTSSPRPVTTPLPDAGEPPLGHAASFAVAGLTGFAGLALETTWERILAIFLPNRTYSFGLVLALYLAGYAIGCLWAGRNSRRQRSARGKLSRNLILLSLVCLLTLPVTALVPGTLFGLRYLLLEPWRQMVLPPLLVAGMLTLPAAFLMGTLLPHTALASRLGRTRPGSEVGLLFGVNLLASVLGSLGAGFLLLPILGSLRTIVAAGALYAALGAAVLAGSRGSRPPKRALIWAALGLLALNTAGIFVDPMVPKILPVSVQGGGRPGTRLLFYEESREGTVCVVEEGGTGIRTAFVNNSMVCGTGEDALKTVRALAHLPVLCHPDPKRVLVIGFGLGVTTGHVLTYPVEEVHCVELCPEIADAAHLFEPYNRGARLDPRVTLHAGDGRAWMKRHAETFDVITCDPTHPTLGSGNLYTREFFRLARERLGQKGIFAQYLPFRFVDGRDLRSLVGTFREAFPDASLWYTASHGILVGSNRRIEVDPREWDLRLRGNPALPDLRRSCLSRAEDWLALLLLGRDQMAAYAGAAPTVTDGLPFVEYPSLAALDPRTWSRSQEEFVSLRTLEAAEGLLSPEAREDALYLATLERFHRAKTLLMQAEAAWTQGDLERASRLLGEARTANWDDTEAKRKHERVLELLGRERLRRYLQM